MHSQRIRQRRRRVTLDTTPSDESTEEMRAGQANKREPRRPAARPYTSGARRSRQFKTTDLIPKRIWSVTAAIALLLAAIAGLNLLHLNSPDWIDVIGHEGVAALSLDSGRGIGVWYSNFLLLLTSCVSLQLFLLRQHRRDDYRGSYRIWLWLGMIFLIASAASVTGIASLFRNVISNTIGSSSGGITLLWVFVIKLAGLAILVVRGLIEVRHSRLAVVGLLIVLLSYGLAHLINEVPDMQVESSEYIHAALGNCLLFGCTALFVSVLGYARFVYLNANGLVKAQGNSKRNANKKARAAGKAEARQERAAAKQLKLEEKEARKKQKANEREQVAAEKAGARENRRKKQAVEESNVEPVRKKTKEKKVAASSTQTKNPQPVKKRKTARVQQATTATPIRKKPAASQQPTTIRKPANRQSTGDDYLMSIDEDEIGNLSKSDRRRLRKLKRRAENRAA